MKKVLTEILEDIALYGAEKKVICYLDAKTGCINDYSLTTERVIYIDEDREVATLFEILVAAIRTDYICSGKNIIPLSAAIKACRQIKKMSQIAFAAFVGSTRRSIENWESGAVEPSLSVLAEVARKSGVSPKIFFLSINEK